MSKIQVESRVAIKRVNDLYSKVTEIKNIENKLSLIQSSLVKNWSGEAADAYYRKLDELRSNLNNSAKKLENSSYSLQKKVNRIVQHDKMLAQEAKKLKG